MKLEAMIFQIAQHQLPYLYRMFIKNIVLKISE